MVSSRFVIRFCVAGLSMCLIYIVILTLEPFQSQCNCKDNHRPEESKPKFKSKDAHFMCLLVPFRDRFNELSEFVPQMTAYLEKKKIPHHIFVINQVDPYRFNRGSLLNAGFLLSESDSSVDNCDYVALHDVDLIPVNDQLPYSFPSTGLRHVSAPGLHPKYDYLTFLGGILLISRDVFRKVDGFSNHYWGWGLEDDEFHARLQEAKLQIERPTNVTTGRKDTFKHYHQARARPRDMIRCYNQWEVTRKRDRETGLHSVKYSLESKLKMSIEGKLFTVFNVALQCDTTETPWCDCSNAPPGAQSKKNLDRKDVIVPDIKKKVKRVQDT